MLSLLVKANACKRFRIEISLYVVCCLTQSLQHICAYITLSYDKPLNTGNNERPKIADLLYLRHEQREMTIIDITSLVWRPPNWYTANSENPDQMTQMRRLIRVAIVCK